MSSAEPGTISSPRSDSSPDLHRRSPGNCCPQEPPRMRGNPSRMHTVPYGSHPSWQVAQPAPRQCRSGLPETERIILERVTSDPWMRNVRPVGSTMSPPSSVVFRRYSAVRCSETWRPRLSLYALVNRPLLARSLVHFEKVPFLPDHALGDVHLGLPLLLHKLGLVGAKLRLLLAPAKDLVRITPVGKDFVKFCLVSRRALRLLRCAPERSRRASLLSDDQCLTSA